MKILIGEASQAGKHWEIQDEEYVTGIEISAILYIEQVINGRKRKNK